MNSITVRKSGNPNKKTSYCCFFYQSSELPNDNPKLVGQYTTTNGSYVELGRMIDSWLNHNSIPVEMERKELI